MPYSCLKIAEDGPVGIVTLARPEKRNAITNAMMEDLERVARDFAKDEQTRAIVVRAEGKDFSVGADLSQPRFQGDPRPDSLPSSWAASVKPIEIPAPTEAERPTRNVVHGS